MISKNKFKEQFVLKNKDLLDDDWCQMGLVHTVIYRVLKERDKQYREDTEKQK